MKRNKYRGFTPLENKKQEHISFKLEKVIKKFCSFIKRNLRLPKGDLSLTGFTLIELMLVIIILGVLGAAIFPRLVGKAQEARITAAKNDINSNLALALDLYEMYSGFFPTTEQGLEALRARPTSSPTPQDWKGPYIKKKPTDPWGNPYAYVSPGVHNEDYDLCSFGPDGAEGGGDDITNWEE